MARVVWPESLLEILAELEERERTLNLERVSQLERFPRLYPVRVRGRFRGHRWFLAGRWLIYYRVVDGTVYLRAVWPARIP